MGHGRWHPALAARPGLPNLEVGGLRGVLQLLYVSGLLRREDAFAWRQGGLAGVGTAKVKFFFWLALHERLWTAQRRLRHGLQPNDVCAPCDQGSETTDHLLASCVFTRACVGLAQLCPNGNSYLVEWWQQARDLLPEPFRCGFNSLVLLVSWVVWKECNRRTFDNISRTLPDVLGLIREEDDSWIAAGFRSLVTLFAL